MHAFFFQACSFSSDLAQVCCQASLSFPPLSFSQRRTFSCPSSDAADEDQRGTEMTVLWHSNVWLTRKTPPGRPDRCLGSPPTPELKQPHRTPQAPKTKPLLVRLSLLSPSNPSSQVPESLALCLIQQGSVAFGSIFQMAEASNHLLSMSTWLRVKPTPGRVLLDLNALEKKWREKEKDDLSPF